MTSPLPGTIITSLPVAISLDGSEDVPIVQGGTTKRTTTGAIGDTATSFVPLTRSINTPANSGLAGGGTLAAGLNLSFLPSNLSAKTAMAVADSFAINDVAGGNVGVIATFPNAMKAITGLSTLGIPNLANDYLIINHAADGLTYKISPSGLSLATGNVPAGGSAGQPLIKSSGTDYDTQWATLQVVGGGTGLTSGTSGGVPYFSSSSALASSAALGTNRIVLGGGAGASPAALGSLGTTTTVLHGNAAGAPTFSAVSLATDVSGTLPVGSGGTGISAGTSGGILGFTATGTIASSSLLTQHAIVVGGGAGATPTPLASLGTTTTLLHGNASGDPTFSAVSLTADVSGTLPVTSGGTGLATVAQGDLLYGSASNTLSSLAKSGTATRYLANTGTSNNPAWDQVSLTNGITGTLGPANGGTGLSSYTVGDLIYASGTTTLSKLADTAVGRVLISGGVGVAPAWSATPAVTSLALGGATIGSLALAATGSADISSVINGVNLRRGGDVPSGQRSLWATTNTSTPAFALLDEMVVVGHNAFVVNASGGNSTGVGYAVFQANTDGNFNSGFGVAAFSTNVHGTFNTACGAHVALTNQGSANTFIGAETGGTGGAGGTGSTNVAVGNRSLYKLTDGADNVGVGHNSLNGITTGGTNTAVGKNSVTAISTGSNNTGLGGYALSSVTTTSNNVAVGFFSGLSTTGSGNVFIGFSAGQNETGSNTFYLDNSNTATPLLGGNFSTRTLNFDAAPRVKTFTIATLPGTPSQGMIASISDGDAALAWGATAVNSGAGATQYLVWYNGAAWTVTGK